MLFEVPRNLLSSGGEIVHLCSTTWENIFV